MEAAVDDGYPEYPATEVIRELRNAGYDVAHGYGLKGSWDEADTAAHVIICARESGVPKELCDELAAKAFKGIIEEMPSQRKGRRRWLKRDRASRNTADRPPELPRGDAPRRLPPGD
jgi:hypothetical protein